MGWNAYGQWEDDDGQQPDMSFEPQTVQGTRPPPQDPRPMPQSMPQQPQPMAALPSQGSLASLMKPQDPEMDQRWRAAENNSLDQSGYLGKPSYGVGEAVRDFLPMAAAGTLDVLANRGRDLPGILGAGATANAEQEKLRRDEAQKAGAFAKDARAQREGSHRQNLGFVSEARQQQQYDMMNNPDHPQALARVAQLVAAGVPREMVEGQPMRVLQSSNALYTPYFRHGAAPLTNGDAADRAGGVRRATDAAADEHFPTELGQKTEIAGDTAAASAGATQDVTHANAPRAAFDEVAKQRALIPPEVEKRVAFEDAGVGSGQGMSGNMKVEDLQASNPNLDFTNPKLVQEALRTRSLTKDVIAKIDGANRGAEVIDRLHDAAEQFQAAAASGDIKAAWNARRLYNSHAEEYAGALEQITGNKSDTAKAGFLKLVPSLADPTAPEGVGQLWSSIEANVGSNLGTYGIKARKPQSLGGPARDAAPQPSAAAGGMQPRQGGAGSMDFMGPSTGKGDPGNGFTAPPSLGTPKPSPKIPIQPGTARGGAAGGGGQRMRIIEDPTTGETESEMMSDEEADGFMRANPGVQIR